MTDAPVPEGSNISHTEQPVTISPEDAYARFAIGDGNLRTLHADLLAEGHKVSYDWLLKRSSKDRWRVRRAAQQRVISASDDHLHTLTAKASVEHYEALEARLVSKISLLINAASIGDGDFLQKHIDVLGSIQALIHTKRGIAVGAGTAVSAPDKSISVVGLGSFTVKKAA